MFEINKEKQDEEGKTKEGKYIYCIIKSKQPQSFGPLGIGGKGDQIYTVCNKDISAVVSNALFKKYHPSRENLIFHERAIEEVMRFYPVLPVRFATVAENDEQVQNILEKEYDIFMKLLSDINGKKELGLKTMFKEDFIYESILAKYENIREMKAQIASLTANESHFQRMQIGEMVENALRKEKELYKEDFLNSLSPLAQEVKINSSYGVLMILNAAFLVNNSKEEEFDNQVNKLDRKYGNAVKIKYLGTVPPFNFVNLALEAGRRRCS